MKRSKVDVLYVDISKVFGNVDQRMIRHKLRRHGITGKINLGKNWENQDAAVNRAISTDVLIECGGPRGTLSRPLMFMIALSDMPSVNKIATLISYAHDAKEIEVVKEPSDPNLIHKDLHVTYNKPEDNNMQFNVGKFQTLC